MKLHLPYMNRHLSRLKQPMPYFQREAAFIRQATGRFLSPVSNLIVGVRRSSSRLTALIVLLEKYKLLSHVFRKFKRKQCGFLFFFGAT